MFIALEKQFFGDENVRYILKDGKLIRSLKPITTFDADKLSGDIVSYVNTVDKLLNLYIIENPVVRDRNLAERFSACSDVLNI
ncbi:MAG: hypothetical protein ACI4M6_01935 [Christensenellaceae bacterium]